MSGHSKWANIKNKKESEDKKRSNVFSKMARLITVAAREGGNPESNYTLRAIIDRAREFDMPQDNIERAIKRGTGEIEGVTWESMLLEGYGPSNVAVIIDVLTDSKNRTLSDIKRILESHGGKMGGQNSVSWMFERKGSMTVNLKGVAIDKDELELAAIDCGADDVEWQNDSTLIVWTKPEELYKVKTALEQKGLKATDVSLSWKEKEKFFIEDPAEREKIEKLFDALNELDDVQAVYSNYK